MSTTQKESELAIGHYLGIVRKEAGLTQAQLAGKITLSPATISRIEAGESTVTDAEREAILDAIDTPPAKELRAYLKQEWVLEQPTFDHPNRKSLWEANAAIKRLRELREDPDINSVFVRQIDVYEKELLRYADYLYGREHQLAFIGSIEVGKTTAICRLTGLTVPGEIKLDRQSVLAASGGRTTLCEVHVSRGPQYGIRIVPRTEDSIRRDVEEYADYLVNAVRQDGGSAKPAEANDGESVGTSAEVARAIRNMAELTTITKDEGGKKVSHDRAKELALQYPKAGELAVQILTRMDLFRRTKRDAWYPEGCSKPPQKWLQEIYSEVNNGKHTEFTLPQKIEVVVPGPVMGSEEFPVRLIDTKGIDGTAARQDLERHFDDDKATVVLCSKFGDAPNTSLQDLLTRAKEAGIKQYEPRTVILVLTRGEDALSVMKDDGTQVESEEEGCEIRKEQVQMQLRQRGIGDVSILFFNSKDNDPEPIRREMIGTLTRFRQLYCDRITKLSKEVDWLIKNRENEEIRLVFQDVGRHLTTWIGKNRKMAVDETPVEKPLVTAIEGTRHAGTIRASVRRYGDWPNLDYYHHLAVGARRLAVKQISARLEKFVDLVKHLMDRDDFAPAKEFLGRVIDRLDAAAEAAYRTTQVGGREAFEAELRKDFPFWGECDDRWGAKRLVPGGKYRDEIRDMTADRFESSYDDAHQLVKQLIAEEWTKIVVLLEEMLREEEGQTVSARVVQ